MSDFALRNFSVWKCFKIKCFDLKSKSLPFSVSFLSRPTVSQDGALFTWRMVEPSLPPVIQTWPPGWFPPALGPLSSTATAPYLAWDIVGPFFQLSVWGKYHQQDLPAPPHTRPPVKPVVWWAVEKEELPSWEAKNFPVSTQLAVDPSSSSGSEARDLEHHLVGSTYWD